MPITGSFVEPILNCEIVDSFVRYTKHLKYNEKNFGVN